MNFVDVINDKFQYSLQDRNDPKRHIFFPSHEWFENNFYKQDPSKYEKKNKNTNDKKNTSKKSITSKSKKSTSKSARQATL